MGHRMAGPGTARRGEARHGKDLMKHHKAGRGGTRLGKARFGKPRHGEDFETTQGRAGRRRAWSGKVRQGMDLIYHAAG